MYLFGKPHSKRYLFWSNCLLAVSALLLTGIVYRVTASRLRGIVDSPIALPVPMKAFPLTIEGWAGRDRPVSETVERVADADDFLSRVYVDNATNQWANVYVAYTARPRTMLGHRPEVCYVAGGWIHDGTERSQLISSGGRVIPCLVNRFHKPASQDDEIVVLSFYIGNGWLTSDESVFTGIGWRTPNIAGNPARYVAQVQISSVLESAVRAAAKDITDLLLDYFPDEEGKVNAVEYSYTGSGVVK